MRQSDMSTQSVNDRLLEKDIARSDSEMLLFMMIFGTENIIHLAKRELSKRISRIYDNYIILILSIAMPALCSKPLLSTSSLLSKSTSFRLDFDSMRDHSAEFRAQSRMFGYIPPSLVHK